VATLRTDPIELDDGSMDLHLWIPDAGPGPGILLIQEIFGVGPYIRAVADRLAGAGYTVGAPDVFWRFAPGWSADHDQAGLESSLAQVANLDPQRAIADCVAARRHLDEVAASSPSGVLGFCLGGTLAFGVAIADEPAVCVSYYGSGVPDMIDGLDQVTCPILFHFGSTDAYIPGEGVERVAAAIADRDDVVLNVELAGHAFDNHESAMFYEPAAAAAAWAKTMAFLGEHLPAG
jgi:carboxymethylenebutenolidase